MTLSSVMFDLSAVWFERNDLQSEHKSSTKSFELIEAEVSRLEASPETPRRRWSAAADEFGQPSPHCSRPPNSTTSILKPGSK
jgi:hypothetical protein